MAADFRLHAQHVRDGGTIAFHDIVPDSVARRGQASSVRTDGVPRFWTKVKEAVPESEELIESSTQVGYGIGVVPMTRESRSRLASSGLLA